MSDTDEAEAAALQWEAEAAKEDRMADFLLSKESIPATAERPEGYRKRAKLYRNTALSIRMTAETGITHCACTTPPHVLQQRYR